MLPLLLLIQNTNNNMYSKGFQTIEMKTDLCLKRGEQPIEKKKCVFFNRLN